MNKKKSEVSQATAGLILILVLVFLGLAIAFAKFADFKSILGLS